MIRRLYSPPINCSAVSVEPVSRFKAYNLLYFGEEDRADWIGSNPGAQDPLERILVMRYILEPLECVCHKYLYCETGR